MLRFLCYFCVCVCGGYNYNNDNICPEICKSVHMYLKYIRSVMYFVQSLMMWMLVVDTTKSLGDYFTNCSLNDLIPYLFFCFTSSPPPPPPPPSSSPYSHVISLITPYCAILTFSGPSPTLFFNVYVILIFNLELK